MFLSAGVVHLDHTRAADPVAPTGRDAECEAVPARRQADRYRDAADRIAGRSVGHVYRCGGEGLRVGAAGFQNGSVRTRACQAAATLKLARIVKQYACLESGWYR
jgi:hypothetical protein